MECPPSGFGFDLIRVIQVPRWAVSSGYLPSFTWEASHYMLHGHPSPPGTAAAECWDIRGADRQFVQHQCHHQHRPGYSSVNQPRPLKHHGPFDFWHLLQR